MDEFAFYEEGLEEANEALAGVDRTVAESEPEYEIDFTDEDL